MIKILFLAANPLNTDRLRLDEEVRAIDEALRKADFRNQFEFYSHWAVRVEDLQDLLLRYKPDLVHFSGHGNRTPSIGQHTSVLSSSTGTDRNLELVPTEDEATNLRSSQIVLQDVNGKSAPVPPRALSTLFRVLKDNIRCVVLNACYSQAQAEGIAQHIDCVIGMSDAIPDVTAIVFATAFYRGLGYGRSLQLAFDLGCSQIDLSALRGSSIPQLIALRTSADRLILAADGAFTQSVAVVEQAPGEPPYKGLHYFDTGDEHLFFGRERLTAELATYLRTHNFLAVVGASGSGKSSVVRAGLVPALQRGEPLLDGFLPPVGSAQWPVHVMTPKAHPLKELAATLTRDDGSYLAQGKLMDELLQDARVLDLCASRLLSGGAANRLLLVVDQFEELFTLCRDQAERKAFVDNLLTAAVEDGVTTVVITLRADFYAHCSQFSNLRLALESQQKYIGPMNRGELRRAIEEPARQEGWDFESGLVDLLLHDVGDEPGALPLLSHALLETWNRRRDRTLTLAGYVESGRVQGAIAQTAERVYKQQLTSEQQAIAKNIFLRLTELGEGSEDTRRRVQLTELMPGPEEKATTEVVLNALANARLITTDEEKVEVAHEALIRAWPTLREWLRDDREGLRIHRQLTEAAQEWEAMKRDPGELYRGLRLEQVQEWAIDRDNELNTLEQEFLKASLAERDRLVAEAKAREREREETQQRELKAAQALATAADQARRRSQLAALAASFAALVLVGFLGYLGWQLYQERGVRALTAAFDLQDQIQKSADADTITQLVRSAKDKMDAAIAADPSLENRIGVSTFITDTLRLAATQLVDQGEQLGVNHDLAGAHAKFTAAFALNGLFADYAVPPEAPLYVFIKGGKFMMGSSQAQIQQGLAATDELSHTVLLDSYWILRTEVTNEQYARCVDAGQCTEPSSVFWSNLQNAKKPVAYVTWFQANDYAQFVGARLPTEAEWEKACRSTDERIYPWSNEDPDATRLNYNVNVGSTTEVGSYPPGANGLYDMAGNLWEWTADWYDENYYATSPDRNPTGPVEGTRRTLRGGSWDYIDYHVRCAFRNSSGPVNNFDNFGFRVVVSSPGF